MTNQVCFAKLSAKLFGRNKLMTESLVYMSNPPELPSDDLISIDSNAADVTAIMADIRARITQRREENGYPNMIFPTYGDVVYPEKPSDIDYDPNLYHHLGLANKLYNDVETEAAVLPSPATRIPILGSFWGQIRKHAHGLVLFYVNRFVDHEVEVDRQLVNVVNLLTIENQRQQREISILQDEMAELKAQMADG